MYKISYQITLDIAHSKLILLRVKDHNLLPGDFIISLNSYHSSCTMSKLALIPLSAFSQHSYHKSEHCHKIKFDICLLKIFHLWADPWNIMGYLLIARMNVRAGASIKTISPGKNSN